MRKYELFVIIRADLNAEAMDSQLEAITGWVETNGGNVVSIDRWGQRRMTYPIKKQRDGYYVLFNVELPPSAPPEIERNIRISEDLLRHLIVRVED